MAVLCTQHFNALSTGELSWNDCDDIAAACVDCQGAKLVVEARQQEEYDNRRCAYCGMPPSEELEVSTHSGVWECTRCWNWRKLDGPAARHWYKVSSEFLDNVDLHDIITFLPERVELDMVKCADAFDVVTKIRDATKQMLIEHKEMKDED